MRSPRLNSAGVKDSPASTGGGQTKCHGGGRFTRGPMNFTYGLTLEEARPYLKLPKGKKLRQEGKKIELVER